jgi:hypothetical protein
VNNTLLIVIVAIAAAASGAGIGLMFARKQDPARAELIDEALATVARTLGALLGDTEIRAVASWVYDAMGVSAYYSKEDWIAYCMRMLRRADQVARTAPDGLSVRT